MFKETMEHWTKSAEKYAVSLGHGNDRALAAVVERAQPQPDDVLLDVATGTGFTAMAFSPHVKTVYASDISVGMMGEARRMAKERGLTNISFDLAPAEALPFKSDTFDIVTCRVAAHHFKNYEKAVQEMARVAKPGGRVILVDTCTPEDQQLADFINELENRRDYTHVASLMPTTLHRYFADNRLHVIEMTVTGPGSTNLTAFVARASTPPEQVEAVKKMLRNASPQQSAAFAIREEAGEFYFGLYIVQIAAVKLAY